MAAGTPAQRLRRASARLTTDAVTRMAALPWFTALPPEERSYVGLVVRAGLEQFASWLRDPSQNPTADQGIFAAAPRTLARAVTLQQTVQLIRVTVEVLEAAIDSIASPEEADALEHAVLRYSREVAFAAAEVYAAAAEARGAWDARTEAGVVDALVRGDVGETVLARAASLGWTRADWVTVLVGALQGEDEPLIAELRTSARRTGLCLLVGEYAGQLLVVLGGQGPHTASVQQVAAGFPPGPVVVGPLVGELAAVVQPIAEARAGLAAVAGWPDAPRPVGAEQLLVERVVLGDELARRRLIEEVFAPLAARAELLTTAATYLEQGGAVEGTARTLYLHPNTVRYRLHRVHDATGRDVTTSRDATEVRLALVLGRTAAG